METKSYSKMQVNPKYVKESIEEYNRSIRPINEQDKSFTTIESNGGIYKVLDMTLEEFTKLNNAIDMNDIRWA